jgi:hypothetical protein
VWALRKAEDADFVAPLDQPAPQRVLGLEADDDRGVLPIADGGPQVVEDATRLAHPAGGDDDRRALLGVDRHRLRGVGDIGEAVELERAVGSTTITSTPTPVAFSGGRSRPSAATPC